MTNEQIRELLDAAVAVAESAPRKPHPASWAARIPWTYVLRLREALTDAGIPWRKP